MSSHTLCHAIENLGFHTPIKEYIRLSLNFGQAKTAFLGSRMGDVRLPYVNIPNFKMQFSIWHLLSQRLKDLPWVWSPMHGIYLRQMTTKSASRSHLNAANRFHAGGHLIKCRIWHCFSCLLQFKANQIFYLKNRHWLKVRNNYIKSHFIHSNVCYNEIFYEAELKLKSPPCYLKTIISN